MLVFAYGSLIWNPGFSFVKMLPALAQGWQRKWCVKSVIHRGTPDCPGRVLGLIPGGSCVGVAYEVSADEEADVMAYLIQREMAECGYRMERIPIQTEDGLREAVCFVADAYVDDEADIEVAASLRTACGTSGTNLEYLKRTHESAESLSVPHGWPRPCVGLSSKLLETIFA